jgi:hypothetical protein
LLLFPIQAATGIPESLAPIAKILAAKHRSTKKISIKDPGSK